MPSGRTPPTPGAGRASTAASWRCG
jgi:hypothetical protein